MVLVVASRPAALLFSFGAEAFGAEAAFLGGAAGLSGLVTFSSGGLALFLFGMTTALFDFVAEEVAGDLAIEIAGAFLLAFDFDAGREVFEVDAGGGLIDFLTAGTGASDEAFEDVGLEYPESGHPFEELWVTIH